MGVEVMITVWVNAPSVPASKPSVRATTCVGQTVAEVVATTVPTVFVGPTVTVGQRALDVRVAWVDHVRSGAPGIGRYVVHVYRVRLCERVTNSRAASGRI